VAWLIAAALSVQPTGLNTEFTRLEDVWNTAHRNADAETLAALWAEDLEVVVPRMPPMSKAEALAFARTARMRFERYETSQIKVRTYGDTAVVTGRFAAHTNCCPERDDGRLEVYEGLHAPEWGVAGRVLPRI